MITERNVSNAPRSRPATSKDDGRYFLSTWWLAFLFAFGSILILIAWYFFLPFQLGGRTGYVIVSGNSMEPNFHLGDLVIVRKQEEYLPGDAVAYYDQEINHFIFHRIANQELGKYTFKGDNNTWFDVYRPTKDAIVGKLWIHIPGVGKVAKKLLSPRNLAIVSGIFGGMLFMFILGKRDRKRGKKSPNSSLFGFAWTKDPQLVEGALILVSALAISSLLLVILSFTQPVWRSVPTQLPYTQTGNFSYSEALTGDNMVYDKGKISTGQPIFLQLTCQVNLDYTYSFDSEPAAVVSGVHSLDAIVRADNGWERRFTFSPETKFSGETSSVHSVLDFCKVRDLINDMEARTGVHQGGYQLTLLPHTMISASIGQTPVVSDFDPDLTFSYDGKQFWVNKTSSNKNPFEITETSVIQELHQEPNRIRLPFVQPQVHLARILSLIGLAVSGLACVFLIWVFLIGKKFNHVEMLKLKYGSLIVDALGKDLGSSAHVIDVARFDDLARLALKHDTIILHQKGKDTHSFSIQSNGTTYRYLFNPSAQRLRMNAGQVSLKKVEDDIRLGIQNNEFQIYYQPVCSLSDRSLVGVEALLRWNHPNGEVLPAEEFIRAANATHLIGEMDAWMVREASAQLKIWSQKLPNLYLAMNLSNPFLERYTSHALVRFLESAGIGLEKLQLELAEPILLEADQKLLQKLQSLHAAGARICLDNYCGLIPPGDLSKLPLESVKISRQLIMQSDNPEKARLTRAIIRSAQGLGLQVAGNGVESEEQVEFLRSNGCVVAQGYLISEPLPVSEMKKHFDHIKVPTNGRVKEQPPESRL